MARLSPAFLLHAAILTAAPSFVLAADDLKVLQLEQDIRELQRQARLQAQQIDELRSRLARAADPSSPAPATTSSTDSTDWIDAARWKQLQPGMSELEVLSVLGPPTSIRGSDQQRVLLYAIEIGKSGFLGGSVTLRDRAVTEIRLPALQ